MIINNWGFLRHPSGHKALLTQYGRGGLTLYRSSLVRLESTATVLVIMSPISVMLFSIWNIIINYGNQSRKGLCQNKWSFYWEIFIRVLFIQPIRQTNSDDIVSINVLLNKISNVGNYTLRLSCDNFVYFGLKVCGTFSLLVENYEIPDMYLHMILILSTFVIIYLISFSQWMNKNKLYLFTEHFGII